MRKRRVRQMFGVGILLTLAFAAVVLIPRERLLRHNAIEIASLKDCVATDNDIGANSEGYAWLSNDDLLILRAKPQQSGLAQVEAIRHDIHTQREMPLADFNRRQANALACMSSYPADSGNPYAREGLDNARLSPDHQKLLWLYGPHGRWNWHVASLDGTTITDFKATCPYPNHSYVCWLPDNRQWGVIVANGSPDFRFYSAETGRESAIKFLLTAPTHPLAFLRDGRLLTNWPENGVPLKVGESRWQDKQLANTLHTINLPGVDSVNEIVVSPDETRFALFCRLSESGSLSPPMRKLRQWLRIPDRQGWAICVCRMDGSDLREIGHVAASENPAQPALPQSAGPVFSSIDIAPEQAARLPHNLKWSPDGKHLCYCQSNALYMVPVE